jgi:hypothetical protein
MGFKAIRRRLRFLPLFRREEGQAAFEFVLILPFFVFFILLLIDFGIMMYEYVSVANAVREGARYGAVNCPGSSSGCSVQLIQDRVLKRSGGILSESDRGDVTVGWIDNSVPPDGKIYGRGDSVVVKVDHDYHFLFFPNNFLGMGHITIPVVSCADMPLEQTDKGTGLLSGSECGG